MVARTLIFIIACASFLLDIQTLLPKAMAMRRTSNVDEFMIEDHRTHRRQNYVVQRGQNDEALDNMDNIGPAYATEPLERETSPEELPAMIVDYANMIRNDIILLDNSVETRTRKRGNIKKYNQAILDPPCSCESVVDNITLGSEFYPKTIDIRKCSKDSCPAPYRCKEIYYRITVLKKKTSLKVDSPVRLPHELTSAEEQSGERSARATIPSERRFEFHPRWTNQTVNVSTGCVCARDYIELN